MSNQSALMVRVRRLVPLAALVAAGGCFATRNDVRVVQSDIAAMRTELLRNDADQKLAIANALKLIQTVNDSLTRMTGRANLMQGDLRGDMRKILDQLLQVQNLMGQSQAYIARIRAENEKALNEAMQKIGTPPAAGTVPPTTAGVADTAVREQTVGPSTLYQNGRDQFTRGSYTTARQAFQTLLSNFPASDLAPDAQFFIGECLSKEKNLAGADAAYAAVVAKYPESPRAPTALFKRAQLLLDQGKSAEAKPLFEEVIKRYPSTDEAGFAADRLKTIR